MLVGLGHSEYVTEAQSTYDNRSLFCHRIVVAFLRRILPLTLCPVLRLAPLPIVAPLAFSLVRSPPEQSVGANPLILTVRHPYRVRTRRWVVLRGSSLFPLLSPPTQVPCGSVADFNIANQRC